MTNKSWSVSLGWEEHDLAGQALASFIHPHDQRDGEMFFSQLSKGINVGQMELRLRHKAGHYVWFQWNAQLTPDQEVCAFGRDVTQTKLAQLQAHNDIRLLQMAEKTAQVGHWSLDIAKGRVTWSQEMYKIYGRKPVRADVALDNFIDAFHGDDRERLWMLINSAIQSGGDIETECRLQRSDGGIRHVLIRAVCEYDDHSQVVGVFGILQDVTETRRTQRDLKIKDDILATAVRATSDGIWDWDLQTNELWYSEQWKAQLGYQDHELENNLQTWSQLIHEEDEPVAYDKLAAYLRGDTERFEMVQRLRHKKGHTVYVLVRAQAIKNDQGDAIRLIGAHTDVTDMKNLENAKSEFTSIVSHELRTPLTALHGALGLVIGQFSDELSDQARSLLDMAKNNSERLNLLINDILDMEKLQSGGIKFDFRSVDTQAILTQTAENLRGYSDQYQVQLDTVGLLPNLSVRADPDRLMQVLSNLLSNAIKFSKTGGIVKLRANASTQGVTISVIDNGCGISREKLPRIFDKFIQADSSDQRNKGGTGLGLTITKALVEKMNGEINVTSQEGEGSTFYVTLPPGEDI